jgi:hypothetical protein
MYSAQGIFQHHFQCKKVHSILYKIRYNETSHNDTENNETENNPTQYYFTENDTQHNETENNETQYDTQQNIKISTLSITKWSLMILIANSQCHYVGESQKAPYAKC